MRTATKRFAAALLLVSFAGFMFQAARIRDLSQQAAAEIRELDRRHDQLPDHGIQVALALLSRNPHAAIASVLSLGHEIWSGVRRGREIKARLEHLSSQLNTAFQWRGFWIWSGAVSMLTWILLTFWKHRKPVPKGDISNAGLRDSADL